MGGGWKGNPRYSGVVFFVWGSRRSQPTMTTGECDLVEEPRIFLCTGEFAAVCMGSIAGRARVRVSGGCGAGEMSAQEKRHSYVSCDSPEKRFVANKFAKLGSVLGVGKKLFWRALGDQKVGKLPGNTKVFQCSHREASAGP